MPEKYYCQECGEELEEIDGELTCRNAQCKMYNMEVTDAETDSD